MATRRGGLGKGASDQRVLMLRYIGRQFKKLGEPLSDVDHGYFGALVDMRAWLKLQSKRAAEKGGIGRR